MTDYGALLRDHVTLRCRSIDRIFLQAYVPKLQTVGLVCTFLRWQRKFKIPSSAAFGKIGEEYVKAVHRFAEAHQIAVVHFKKGQDKEKTARPYLDLAAREGKDRVEQLPARWRAGFPSGTARFLEGSYLEPGQPLKPIVARLGEVGAPGPTTGSVKPSRSSITLGGKPSADGKVRALADDVHFHSHNFDVTLSLASVLCSNTTTMPARFANFPVAVTK